MIGGRSFCRRAGGAPSTSGEGSYLDRIVPDVLRRVEERKSIRPQIELAAMGTPGARPSFAAAVRAPGVSLIAEVKRASPSKGALRPDLDVGSLVQAYETGGARAVSVLTEQDHFMGGPDDLRAAAAHTRLPLLCKDFIFDPYQMYEARAYGASAVLLIAALLDDYRLQTLTGLAQDLDLDVLLEVHDEAELARALRVEQAMIGINNRDLRTFEVTLATTRRLAALVPAERLLVGESGIRSHSDVEELGSYGVDAVLVGETILREPDVDAAVRRLMCHPPPVAARSAGHRPGREV